MMFLKYEKTCRDADRLPFSQAWQCYHLLLSPEYVILERVHARWCRFISREPSRDSRRFFCLAFCVCGMLNVLLFSGCCSQRYRQAKVILVMHFVYEYFCEWMLGKNLKLFWELTVSRLLTNVEYLLKALRN